MNGEWSLEKLYKGFDDPAFAEDEKKLAELIEKLDAFSKDPQGTPTEVLKTGVGLFRDIEYMASKLFSFASLRQSVNTSDTEASAACGRLYQLTAGIAGPNARLTTYIAGLEEVDAIIESDPLLKEHSFFLHNIRENSKHILSPETEQAISLYEVSGSGAWSDLQSYLTSIVPVEYKGEKTNLSDIRNKAYDPDPEVRKEAYEAEIKAYDRIKDAIAYSLNSIKMEVISRCKLKGYESPLAETLENAHMTRATLDALIGAMVEYLPKFWEYMKAKAKLLGHENGLPWYDLFAPLKGNERKFTAEEAKEYLVSLFSGFCKDEADMMARAFDEEWIDFYPREGKVGGAFCSEIYALGESRVLTNFDGMLGDVITLAHELGHAFHNFNLKDNSILNLDVSMPMAETASTFNEVVAMNAAIAEEKDPTARRALIESQLMDANQIICDIYSRYLFETAVFENRESEFMFADDLCKIMLDAQQKAYGDGLDPEIKHPFMWVCKSHYYSGGLSFYNFPYAFGGLFARGLYAKYLQQGESFVPMYRNMLKASGSMSVEDAAKLAGVDTTDPGFWKDSLQILADEIDEFVKLCEN